MKRLILLFLVLLAVNCAKEPETYDELITAGERSFLNGDYFEARGYLTQAVKKKPSERRVLYLLGLTYSRELMYDSATFYLGRADVLYPKDREINLALYEAALNSEDYAAARKALRVMIDTGDPLDQHLEMLAQLSLQIEDLSFAHYYYRQLMDKYPDNPDYYVQVGNTAADIGSLKVAMAVVDSAIERFGPNESFLSNKGTYLAAQRKYPEAEAIFRSLLAEDSTVAAYRLNLASSLVGQDDSAKQREALVILRDLRATIGNDPIIDSTVNALEMQLRARGR